MKLNNSSFTSSSKDVISLADIYQKNCNLAIWKRKPSDDITRYIEQFIDKGSNFTDVKRVISVNKVKDNIEYLFPDFTGKEYFIKDLSLIIEMFGYLFELKDVGLRCNVIHKTMCPNFHVDRVPCRLILTYYGEGTEYLSNSSRFDNIDVIQQINESEDRQVPKKYESYINQINNNDVALLKGTLWDSNYENAVIHRSPVNHTTSRMVMTLDFV